MTALLTEGRQSLGALGPGSLSLCAEKHSVSVYGDRRTTARPRVVSFLVCEEDSAWAGDGKAPPRKA